jgi:hypothetical protein
LPPRAPLVDARRRLPICPFKISVGAGRVAIRRRRPRSIAKGDAMRGHVGNPRAVRRLLCGLAALLVSACASTPEVIPADANAFKGLATFLPNALQDAATPARPLRVLLIHGMGTATANDFDPFILALAGRLGLTQIPPQCAPPPAASCVSPTAPPLMTPIGYPIDIPGVPDADRALVYTYRFAATAQGPRDAAPPAMTISYLLWSPLTATIKCDSLDETTCPEQSEKLKLEPKRQWFAGVAKDFIDDKLADVVLYLGKYGGRALRPTVESALCHLSGGRPTNGGRNCDNDNQSIAENQPPTVIITHSLGGYMLIDAIHDELTRGARGGERNEHTAAAKIVASTQLIFMMANQLALLDLADLRSRLYPAAAGDTVRHGGAPAATAIGDLIGDWSYFKPKAHLRLRAGGPPAPVDQNQQIVAFSDPNDILSWLVNRANVETPRSNSGDVTLTNVYMANDEFEIPGVFSDPTEAHEGYMKNPTVLDLLACGMSAGVVAPCPAAAAR